MWKNSKQVFTEEYHNIFRETYVTSGDIGFQSANAMKSIGGELEDLAMAEASEKGIEKMLTKIVEALTNKTRLSQANSKMLFISI